MYLHGLDKYVGRHAKAFRLVRDWHVTQKRTQNPWNGCPPSPAVVRHRPGREC